MHLWEYGVLGGVVIGFGGAIWILVTAFRDSIKHGLLCTFIPPYAIYYVISRWARTRIAFSVWLVGLGIFIYCAAWHPFAKIEPSQIVVATGYEIQHIFRPELTSPSGVDIGTDDNIFVTEWEEHGIDRIVQISSDGTLSTYAEVDLTVQAIACSPSGDVVVCDNKNLVKISPTGEKKVLARDIVPGGMAFGPSGNLFLIHGENLIRLTPDGEKSVLATGLPQGGGDMAISPSGDVFFSNWQEGKIFKVDQGGAITTLASGFIRDAFNIAFDNEGNLYTNQSSLVRVSLQDGSLSPPLLTKYNVLINSRPFVFNSSGDVVFVGPTSNTVIKASLDGQRVTCLVEGIGNSRALAVGPSGDLFMGASDAYPVNPGRIARISTEGNIIDFISGFTTVQDITFDTVGNMYVFDFDYAGELEGRLLKVAPDGNISTIFAGSDDLHSIAIDPVSGDIFGFLQHGPRRIIKITPDGDRQGLPIDFGGELQVADLAFDQQANLIVLAVFKENYETGPVHRGLFRVTPDYEVTLITNIDTELATSEDDVAIHPSGDIFVVGPERHPWFRMLHITQDGEVDGIAWSLPFDALSLTINPKGEIFFTCSDGLFKMSQSRQ